MDELELALRQRATQYLEGTLSLPELHSWIAAAGWNVDARGNAAVAQLYHDVELLLAEHFQGDWTETELKDRLAPFAKYVALEVSPTLIQTMATASAVSHPPLNLAPAGPVRFELPRSLVPAFTP